MAEDMYRFIRELQPEKPLFYGHSDGGIIGLLLETIRIPVLVTVGEHDLILPEETQRIVQHLPKLTVVEGEERGITEKSDTGIKKRARCKIAQKRRG